MLITGCPREGDVSAAWSRPLLWRDGPGATALHGLVIAGPGERLPAVPWPAVGGIAVLQRPQSALAAPGGAITTIDLPYSADNSLVAFAGPSPYGALRLAGDEGSVRTTLSVDAGGDRTAAASSTRIWRRDTSLDLLAMGSLGEAADLLLLADGTAYPSYRFPLHTKALARRYSSGGQTVDRFAAQIDAQHTGTLSLMLGAGAGHHGVAGAVGAVDRASGIVDGDLSPDDGAFQWLALRGGLRADAEQRGDERRFGLAPQLLASLTDHRHDISLLASGARETGLWMPKGVGISMPAVRVWQLEVAHQLRWGRELWGGLRRVDTEIAGGEPGEIAEGDPAVFGGISWDAALTMRIEGAVSPAGRWSTAAAALSYAPSCGRTGPNAGLVSMWRSGPGALAPPGVHLALPPAETAHLDNGLRLAAPFAVHEAQLVFEGTSWIRMADSTGEDLVFVPTIAAKTAEIALRLEW